MGIKVVTPPTTYPVSLHEAKQHVRAFDHDDDDELLQLYIKAATANAEDFTGRAFIDQTLDYYLDGFPTENGLIEQPKPPIIEIEGVFYSDGAAVETEYPIASYLIDAVSQKGRIALWSGSSWPTLTNTRNTVRIRYRAGYVADPEASPPVSNVPPDIKAAILLQVGTMYANRESVVVGESVTTVPLAWEHLLRPYRVHTAIA